MIAASLVVFVSVDEIGVIVVFDGKLNPALNAVVFAASPAAEVATFGVVAINGFPSPDPPKLKLNPLPVVIEGATDAGLLAAVLAGEANENDFEESIEP